MKTLVILGLVFLLAFLYSLLGAACYGLVEALFSFFGIHNEFVIAIFHYVGSGGWVVCTLDFRKEGA